MSKTWRPAAGLRLAALSGTVYPDASTLRDAPVLAALQRAAASDGDR